MDDRTLLELAAKAAGLPPLGFGVDGAVRWRDEAMQGVGHDGGVRWNPLAEDADAFRLLVTIGKRILSLYVSQKRVIVEFEDGFSVEELLGDDPPAATRRAIVRAAARCAG